MHSDHRVADRRERLHQRLLWLADALTQESAAHADRFERCDPADWEAAAAVQHQTDLDLCRLCTSTAALSEVRAALDRMERGTYGYCELCGRRISPTRLKVIPWTRYCADTERRLARNGPGTELRTGALRHWLKRSGSLAADGNGAGGGSGAADRGGS